MRNRKLEIIIGLAYIAFILFVRGVYLYSSKRLEPVQVFLQVLHEFWNLIVVIGIGITLLFFCRFVIQKISEMLGKK